MTPSCKVKRRDACRRERTSQERATRRGARVARVVAWCLVLGLGCARRPVDPNEAYRDPRMSAAEWQRFFETDGRGELYRKRDAVLKLAGVRPGMRVADVGAGTGLFSMMLSDAVGESGRVYAEEVVDRFSRFIAERALRENRANVVSVVGTELGIGLPPASIDLAFLCDVYHHFDHPREMLSSIHQALAANGQLVVVDFKRDATRSPAWVLEHVRADEETVIKEIEQAGFTSIFVDNSLQESYALRFKKTDPKPDAH
jgi:predicted methyltransferase